MSARPQFIARDVDVVPAAALIAEPARAAMITALLDDRPLAAGELARVAGVSPATASAHLARLLGGGLVTMIRQGRHRYYRLAGPEVAAAMEALAHLSTGQLPVRSLRESRDAAALAEARTCYDHLAGRAGVALLDALLARGILAPAPGGGQLAACGPEGGVPPENGAPASPAAPGNGGPAGSEPPGNGAPAGGEPRGNAGPSGGSPAEGGAASADPGAPGQAAPQGPVPAGFRVTAEGMATLTSFGLNIGALERTRRRFAGACLDWTERKPHLNGALGAAVTARLLGLGWIERGVRRRAVNVTPAGREGLAVTFGWSLED
jgi:DNA-binding transcriptional ArsR family regulator